MKVIFHLPYWQSYGNHFSQKDVWSTYVLVTLWGSPIHVLSDGIARYLWRAYYQCYQGRPPGILPPVEPQWWSQGQRLKIWLSMNSPMFIIGDTCLLKITPKTEKIRSWLATKNPKYLATTTLSSWEWLGEPMNFDRLLMRPGRILPYNAAIAGGSTPDTIEYVVGEAWTHFERNGI